MNVNTLTPKSVRTREALLGAARELFAERGYAATSIEEIVSAAGVTRGALYHQFEDKEHVFRAVYEQIEHDFAGNFEQALRKRIRPGATAWDEVAVGAQVFLDLALNAEVQRIVLLDAPAVLGRGASHNVARFGLEMIRRGLLRSMERGYIAPQPIEPLARLLRAAITEGAAIIARAPDHTSARDEVGAAVERLLSGLAQRAPQT